MSPATSHSVNVVNNQPPYINSIDVSPVATDGRTVWGDVTISASVSDPDGSSDIDRVEFYSANGSYLITTDYTAPYSVIWYTRGYVPNGTQVLKVKTYDKAGHVTEKTREVIVANQ